MKRFLFFFLMLFSVPCNAQNLIDAKKVDHIGVFDDWNAYIFKDKKDKVCFVSSQPLKSTGEYTRRGDVFLIVSHRPNEQIFDVLTFVAGYTFMPRSEVQFRVGNVKANLFTSEDTAWAKDDKTDAALVEQMKAGSNGVVRGKSKRGTATTDTFSFKGFSKAYQAISVVCGKE